MKIIQAQPEHLDIVRELFREYQTAVAADSSQCFKGFEDELANLPGSYANPKGIIFLAFSSNNYSNSKNAIGCIAVQPRNGKPKEAEIKRLYVRSNKRTSGVAKQLLANVFLFAKTCRYSGLFLETTASMQTAKSLYAAYGFAPTKSNNELIECYQYLFKQDAK